MKDNRTDISVVAFVGPETLPLLVGEENGYYAQQGLHVRCEAATGSIDQMVRLIDGQCDVAMTAVDNVVAYAEGQGAAVTERSADLIAFLGNASEPRPLVCVPEIGTIAALRGRRVAVDALNTGFSFLLRQMLEDHGLGMADYELVPVGAPPARWQAMREGDCAAALLSKAFAGIAGEAGCHELRPDVDPWERYQGGVYTARRSWAATHRQVIGGFIRGTLAAVDWILDPPNLAELPALLVRHLPHMPPEAAEAAAAELQSPRSLLKPGLPLNLDGLGVVLALRGKYGTPPVTPGDPEKYLDLSCYAEAVSMR